MEDQCGTDCRALQREAMKTVPDEVWSKVWNRKMEQVCDQCGQDEPAGGMCSRCGHYAPPTTWYEREPRPATEARMAAMAKARAVRAQMK